MAEVGRKKPGDVVSGVVLGAGGFCFVKLKAQNVVIYVFLLTAEGIIWIFLGFLSVRNGVSGWFYLRRTSQLCSALQFPHYFEASLLHIFLE